MHFKYLHTFLHLYTKLNWRKPQVSQDPLKNKHWTMLPFPRVIPQKDQKGASNMFKLILEKQKWHLFSLAWHCAMGIRTDQPIKRPPTSPVGLSRDLVKNSANVFKCLHMFDEGFFFLMGWCSMCVLLLNKPHWRPNCLLYEYVILHKQKKLFQLHRVVLKSPIANVFIQVVWFQ